MEKKVQKLPYAAFFLLIFGFLFLWFAKIHPLIPFDGDDWTYLAYVRLATPIWGEWNPSKVFPEVLYPLFSTFAAYALTPLTGDYITAQTLMHAFVVSAAITGYLWCFACLMRRLFSCSLTTTAVLTTLFFALHFLVFRTGEENNMYLFLCVSLNCYYNYLLPMLLNASLVMLLLANQRMGAFLKSGKPEIRGLLYVIVYLAIFSNLAASGILAAYAGSCLLLELIRIGKGFRFRAFVREHRFHLGILAAWLISAVFELSGGRAGDAMAGGTLLGRLHMTCFLLKSALLESNRLFLISSGIVVGSALVCMLLSGGVRSLGQKLASVLGTFLISTAAVFVYMILLCAAVDPAKITACEYLFAIYFHILLLVLLALGYLAGRCPNLMLALPLLLLFLVYSINTRGNTFRDSNTCGLPPERCAALSRYIVKQFQEADAAGQQEMTLYLPQFTADPENGDNWPYTLFLVERIPGTLYEHGVTKQLIDITPVIDPAVNAQLNIPLPAK